MKAVDTNVIFILKTNNFAHDQRIHKEADLLLSDGMNISFIVKSCDEINDLSYDDYTFIRKVKWIRDNNRGNLVQHISDLLFQLSAYTSLVSLNVTSKDTKKEKSVLWVCDPIMFPLVFFAKATGYKVIWDHHELPPKKYLNNKIFTKLFGISYKVSDLCINVNSERLQYLEKVLGLRSKNKLIMSNLPETTELREVKPNSLPTEFDQDIPFVYLQNSYSNERCGHEIFQALKNMDINIVCSGDFTKDNKKSLLDDYGFNQDYIYDVGFISQKEINWCLSHCLGTIILYRNTSLNQWFCDPNRLYQAMAIGTSIITASNPTIVSTLEQYRYENAIVLENDGSSIEDIKKSIVLLKNKNSINKPLRNISLWSDYSKKLANAISKV